MRFKLTLFFSIFIAVITFNSCKKTEKQLVGDWKLDSLYINGVKQPTSDTCTLFTIQRNMDQFFLKNYICSTNQHVSTSEGVWELKDKKKTLKLTFTQSTQLTLKQRHLELEHRGIYRPKTHN
jgi:hypothetical protein